MACLLHLLDTRREVAELALSAQDFEGVPNGLMRARQVQEDSINAALSDSILVLLISFKQETIGKDVPVRDSDVGAEAEVGEVDTCPAHSVLIKLKSVEVARGHHSFGD